MKRILTVCPSRGRPDRLAEMAESFYATSSESDLLVIIDKTDTEKVSYRKLKDKFPQLELWENSLTNNSARFNLAFEVYPNYDYYHITNDDVVYRTDNWDKTFIGMLDSRPGIAFGDDGIHSGKCCTFPVISGDIIRALGWLQLPTLVHGLYGDDGWLIIGKMIQSIYFFKHVLTEHMHPMVDKAEMDETYHTTNSKAMYGLDHDEFMKWCAKDALKDIKRIKEYLNAKH